MLLYHRILPRLLFLPSAPTSQLLLCPSRFPPRRALSRCYAALSQLAAPETVDHSDAEEPQREVQVQLPLDRLFVPPGASVAAGDEEAVTARVLKGSNIVLGPYARGDAQVVAADFVKSSVRPDDCPRDGLPEFALVGRSNVGKSSLLNSLVRRKRLALTSKKPGKTQCINHFKVNESWYLVDLPGYGYASAPQEARKDWDEFTRNYFLSRDNLVSVFLLIDASIPAKKIDLDYASWLGQNKIHASLVSIRSRRRPKQLPAYSPAWQPLLVTSLVGTNRQWQPHRPFSLLPLRRTKVEHCFVSSRFISSYQIRFPKTQGQCPSWSTSWSSLHLLHQVWTSRAFLL